MAKGKEFSQEQKQHLQRLGLKPQFWTLVKEMPHSMIIRQVFTGEFKVINM